MSWQMAMMAGSAAMSAVQGIVSGAQGIGAAQAGAEASIMGSKIRAAQGRAAAAQTGLEISETRLQTAQQEILRRREVAKLWQANAIDAVARGAVSDGQDSVGVTQAENARLAAEDIGNIKLMGESRVAKLSFRQTQQNLGAMASDLEAINTGDFLSRQIQSIGTGMLFKVLGAGLSFGASAAGSGDPGTKPAPGTTQYPGGGGRYDIVGGGAYGLGPGD